MMIRLIPRPYLILGLTLALLAAYGAGLWRGNTQGAAREVARQRANLEALQARYDAAASDTLKLSREIEDWRDANHMLAMQAEADAAADPGNCGRVPGPNSVRRLARRWGADSPTP